MEETDSELKISDDTNQNDSKNPQTSKRRMDCSTGWTVIGCGVIPLWFAWGFISTGINVFFHNGQISGRNSTYLMSNADSKAYYLMLVGFPLLALIIIVVWISIGVSRNKS